MKLYLQKDFILPFLVLELRPLGFRIRKLNALLLENKTTNNKPIKNEQ